MRRLIFYVHFNPLPRKEGDSGVQINSMPNVDFNPLPRKEGDQGSEFNNGIYIISIHSLVKRETSNVPISFIY